MRPWSIFAKLYWQLSIFMVRGLCIEIRNQKM